MYVFGAANRRKRSQQHSDDEEEEAVRDDPEVEFIPSVGEPDATRRKVPRLIAVLVEGERFLPPVVTQQLPSAYDSFTASHSA